MSLFNLCSDRYLKQSGMNNNTLTKTGVHWKNSAYGRRLVDSIGKGIYSWNIKMEKKTSGIAVGIVSNLHHQEPNKDFNSKHSYWINLETGSVYVDGIQQNKNIYSSHKCKTGDTYTLILNLEKAQLQCVKNADKKILYKNIKRANHVKYRLAVSIYDPKNSITVSENHHIKEFGHDEEKKNQESDVAALIQKLKSLEGDNNKKTSEIEELKRMNGALKKENKSLKTKVERMENERKEFEMEINDLKQRNKHLRLQNINTDNYQEWNADEIVAWMISLDPQIYGQYEEELIKLLNEEEVNGKCMIDIHGDDIKRWGIKNFQHNKALLKSIKLLIENKKPKNEKENEGIDAPTGFI